MTVEEHNYMYTYYYLQIEHDLPKIAEYYMVKYYERSDCSLKHTQVISPALYNCNAEFVLFQLLFTC